MHKPYEVLRGITLPGSTGIVTSRVLNWLQEANYKIKPASCVVESLGVDALRLGKVFVRLGRYLMESAGVNVVVDTADELVNQLKTLYPIVSTGCVQIVDSSIEGFTFPVDYTVFTVADQLLLKNDDGTHRLTGGYDGNPNYISIFATWDLVYTAVLLGERVVIDFANVRDPDVESSGKESFIQVCNYILEFALNPSIKSLLKVLSEVCATIKRGSFRRRGAMTTSLESTSRSINAYLDIPFAELSHVKKGVLIRKDTVLTNPLLIQRLIELQNKGEIFFEKALGYSQDQELRTNVCRAIRLIPGDQCLISVVNFGMVRTYADIVIGFTEVTKFLLSVHALQLELGHPLLDRQIAVSVTGLANMIRNFGTTYTSFIQMLSLYNFAHDNCIDLSKDYGDNIDYLLISHIDRGIQISSQLGKEAGMRACLAVEPGESCSRRYKDIRGLDITPNIDPPNVVVGVGVERRHSEAGVYANDGSLINPEFSYGTDIFTASQLSEAEHFTLWNEYNYLQNKYGMAHGACFEMWYEWTWTSFIQWWYSSLPFVYYNRRIGTKHLEKGSALSARDRMHFKRTTTLAQNNPGDRAQIVVIAEKMINACDITEAVEGCSSCGD